MSIVSALVVFSLVWWLVFFMALPIGVQVPEEQQAGNAASAPSQPALKQKIGWTTLIAAVITILWCCNQHYRWLDWGLLLGLS